MDPQRNFDRLDVAEFNRRLEAMAQRVGDLATNVAVMVERDTKRSEDVQELKDSLKIMGDTFATGRGAVYILVVGAGVLAAVVGFWDKIARLWGH